MWKLFSPKPNKQAPVVAPAQRVFALPRHASLWFKTLLIVATTLLGLLVIVYLPLRQVVLSSFEELEQQQLQTDLQRVQYALEGVLYGLGETVGGYSYWDDTYTFIDTRDPAYIAGALGDQLFTDVPLSVVLLVNPRGQIVYGRAFDTSTQRAVPVPPELWHMGTDDPLLTHADANSVATGVLALPTGPLLVAARPVVRTDGSGPINGTIIFGRYLDEALVQQLGQTVQLAVRLHQRDQASFAPNVRAATAGLSLAAPFAVVPRDAQTIDGYWLLDDLSAQQTLVFQVTSNRHMYAQGQHWVRVFLLTLTLAGLIFGALMLFLLRRAVLARVERLNAAVQEIEQTRDLSQRVPTKGDDELAALGGRINRMLAALAQAQHERLTAAALREQVQVQDEALRAKRAFLSVVSHELRTPLTPILGYTDMLLAGGGGPLSFEQQDMLERIRQNVRDMTVLVDDVLEIGRLEVQRVALHLAPVDLAEVCADVVAALYPAFVAKQLTLTAQLDPELPPIAGDRLRLRQVLMNLLTNACKYTPHGSVMLTARCCAEHEIELQVADTGIGMTPEQLALLFTPFYRADTPLRESEPGTGLGLTIVKALVELHHGTVSVQSEHGVGTVVTCRLPVEQPFVAEASSDALQERVVGQAPVA